MSENNVETDELNEVLVVDEQPQQEEEDPQPVEVFEWNTSLICRFCREGDLTRLRRFVEFSQQMKSLAQYASELVDRLDTETGLSPLHHAARYQQIEICLLLLSNIKFNLGVNIRDADGRTPIHFVFRSSSNCKTRCQGEFQVETDFGNQIQDYESWQNEYNEKIMSSEHPLIYLFSRVHGDLNAQDKYLLTPLHYAVTRNNIAGVKQLIALNANVEIEDRQRIRPLHIACRDGFVSIVEFLLIDCQAEIDVIDADGWTPLHYACAQRHLEIVQLIKSRETNRFVDLLRMKTNIGAHCLHLVVQSDHFPSVEFVVNEFSEKNLKSILNEQVNLLGTPLHIAAKFSDRKMINYLFQRGADPTIFNDQGQTALHLATSLNRRSIVEELLQLSRTSILELKDKNGRTALSLTNDLEIFDIFIENNANISTVDHRQMNPLMIAVEKQQIEIVERYFSLLNDRLTSIIDQVEKTDGSSIFLLAVRTGSIELCSFLLDQSIVRWNTTNNDRMNLFHLAARSNNDRLIDFLCHSIVRKSANLTQEINATDDEGRSPLHIAAELGHTASIEILLKHGANVLLTNHLGQSPLFIAVQHGRTAATEILIDASMRFSSDFQSFFSRRQSPLIVACQTNHVDLVRLLISNQIGIFDGLDFPSNEEKNPLEIAIEHRQRETIKVLLDHPHSQYWLMPIRQTNKRNHQTPLREMIESMDDCAKYAFDRMIIKSHDTDLNGNHFERTVYHYKFLDDYLTPEGDLYSNSSRELYRNHPLIIALDKGHHSLLDHPLAEKLMLRKWKLYRSIYYFPRIITFLLLFVLTCYALIAPAPQLKTTSSLTKLFQRIVVPMCSIIIFLSTMNLLKILWEIFLFRGFRLPFAQIFGIISYLLAIVAFIPNENEIDRIIPRQWQLNSIAILFQWFNVAVVMRSTPMVGKYLVMLESILWIFIRIIFVTSPLFIAFTISTHMLFFNQPSFSNILASIHKSSAMLVGELDYQTLFFSKPTLSASMFIFFPFLFIMTVVFMNFLLGMTVGTIDYSSRKIRAKANAYWIREVIFIETITPLKKLFKSNLVESETIDELNRTTFDVEEENQYSHVLQLTKLVDILEMLCQQAKQTLTFENQLESSLRSLLDQKK